MKFSLICKVPLLLWGGRGLGRGIVLIPATLRMPGAITIGIAFTRSGTVTGSGATIVTLFATAKIFIALDTVTVVIKNTGTVLIGNLSTTGGSLIGFCFFCSDCCVVLGVPG